MNYDLNSYRKPCPKVDCRKKACECGLDYVLIPAALEDVNPPKKGAYCNALVEYEQSGRIYVYSREGIPVEVKAGDLSKALADEIKARIDGDDALKEDLATEAGIRERADSTLEQEIENLKNNPDVVDIVDSYADLQAYDTSTLGDRDIVRVLTDETHDNESSYYRWDKPNSQWVFIGAVEGYYTKGQTDTLLSGKQDKLTAGANITIDPDTNEISATDTTYSNFVGTDGVDPGTAGLVPAPTVADAGKFLKADGTWGTVQAGPTVVQTTGTSTTDVMSQNATTSMVFADPSTAQKIRIGNTNTTANYAVNIGGGTIASGEGAVSIGKDSFAQGISSVAYGRGAIVYGGVSYGSVAIGQGAIVGQNGSNITDAIALGRGSRATRQGEINVEDAIWTNAGFNGSRYRLLSGLYDPQSAHDAATKGYVDTAVASANVPVYLNDEFNNIWEDA